MNWKIISFIVVIILVLGFIIYSFDNRCDYNDSSKRYVAKSVSECSLIDFICEPNEKGFSNDCGCGCVISEE